MNSLFAFIFVSGLASGLAYGVLNHFSGVQLLIPVLVGGFFGSGVVALCFTYLYFTHTETDKEKIKRLKNEIDSLKKEKH